MKMEMDPEKDPTWFQIILLAIDGALANAGDRVTVTGGEYNQSYIRLMCSGMICNPRKVAEIIGSKIAIGAYVDISGREIVLSRRR